MNTTENGSSSWSCSRLINPVADKIRQTVAYNLILLSSLVGNSLIVLIVYKTPALRKPINMLIANMAMSDLLYPIFLFPVRLADLHVGSWLIGGTLGQALCKIYAFLTYVSTLVSIQSLVLISAERFGARGNVVRASVGGGLRRDKLTFYLRPSRSHRVLLYPCCPLTNTLLHHPDQA